MFCHFKSLPFLLICENTITGRIVSNIWREVKREVQVTSIKDSAQGGQARTKYQVNGVAFGDDIHRFQILNGYIVIWLNGCLIEDLLVKRVENF